MVTEESLLAEMCRYADASENGGFDGKEHPEYLGLVKSVLSPLYPITIKTLVESINRSRKIDANLQLSPSEHR
jgi:hypothetical protein